MAKLPAEFTVEDIHDKRFRYTDAVEMLAAMRLVRRRLGWTANWMGADDSQTRFLFYLMDFPVGEEDPVHLCGFEILAKAIHQNLWPSLYPNNKEVPELRRLFIDTPRGANGVAALVNQTTPDLQPTVNTTSDQSALDMLLDDDE